MTYKKIGSDYHKAKKNLISKKILLKVRMNTLKKLLMTELSKDLKRLMIILEKE